MGFPPLRISISFCLPWEFRGARGIMNCIITEIIIQLYRIACKVLFFQKIDTKNRTYTKLHMCSTLGILAFRVKNIEKFVKVNECFPYQWLWKWRAIQTNIMMWKWQNCTIYVHMKGGVSRLFDGPIPWLLYKSTPLFLTDFCLYLNVVRIWFFNHKYNLILLALYIRFNECLCFTLYFFFFFVISLI